jgi:hypothetical protein
LHQSALHISKINSRDELEAVVALEHRNFGPTNTATPEIVRARYRRYAGASLLMDGNEAVGFCTYGPVRAEFFEEFNRESDLVIPAGMLGLAGARSKDEHYFVPLSIAINSEYRSRTCGCLRSRPSYGRLLVASAYSDGFHAGYRRFGVLCESLTLMRCLKPLGFSVRYEDLSADPPLCVLLADYNGPGVSIKSMIAEYADYQSCTNLVVETRQVTGT